MIAAVVFTGTMYPPFVNLLLGIQLSVGAPFYDQAALPLTAPLILAMAVGPMLPWKRAALGPALVKLWYGGVIALVIFAVFMFRGHVVTALGLAGALWVICGAFADLSERIQLFRIPITRSISRLFSMPRASLGAACGHLGFGITILGIAGMTLQIHTITVLRPGQGVDLGGYRWTLERIYNASGPDYAARVALIDVTRHGKHVMMMRPERRFFTAQHVTTEHAAIRTNGLWNMFATFANEDTSGGAEFRFNVHPLAPEIWLGGLVMALGGGLSLSDRRFRIGAPARRSLRKPQHTVEA